MIHTPSRVIHVAWVAVRAWKKYNKIPRSERIRRTERDVRIAALAWGKDPGKFTNDVIDEALERGAEGAKELSKSLERMSVLTAEQRNLVLR